MSNQSTQEKEEQAQPKLRAVTSLKDLGVYIYEVKIVLGEEALVFPMRTMSFKRWSELGREVKDPPRFENSLDVQNPNKDGSPRAYFDPEHPEYVNARGEAQDQRSYSRLLECLETVPIDYEWKNAPGQKGPIQIDGETRKERIKALAETMDVNIMGSLLMLMMQNAPLEVVSRAKSFQ
jgi:hypothetical protein